MNIDVHSKKMVVISDLHIGNPFCGPPDDLLEFMSQVRDEGYDLCINGDGFDIMQTSITEILKTLPSFIGVMRNFKRNGLKIYYVVGNHDLALEEMIHSFEDVVFCPFMNLTSGDRRIRIEHGYVYDPAFVKNPILYDRLVHVAGFFLKLTPSLYRLWIRYERFKNKKSVGHEGLDGEPEEFFKAAKVISDRGFDSVIFGHTHHPGSIQNNGVEYHNTGSFMLNPYYALIDSGKVQLKQWFKGHSIGD